jgi:ribosome-binding protein aMBF1 (putative translation factor)
MIQNQLQYKVTKSRLKEFTQALATLSQEKLPKKALEVRRRALESMIEELESDIATFETHQNSDIPDLSILEDLPKTLVRARIAAGLTQAELAQRLGMKAQQVQRYEASQYASASLERLQEVARAIQGK